MRIDIRKIRIQRAKPLENVVRMEVSIEVWVSFAVLAPPGLAEGGAS
jgi:hypothetical protein